MQRKKETTTETNPGELKDTTHNVRYLMGQFEPSVHPLFQEIDLKYADQRSRLLRKEALEDFISMWEAATKDSIHLKIVSATRNFDYQKEIWEKKWSGHTILSDGTRASDISNVSERARKILLYSAMPGTSRHHWGTDVDLNSFENRWFESGEGLRLYNWLLANAYAYGFCQVYTDKGPKRPFGYEEEKWHWTYMPLSKPLTDYAKKELRDEMITGFNGAEVAYTIEVVEKYVLGIDMECLK